MPLRLVEAMFREEDLPRLPQLDGNEADDKIIAVLENDLVWGHALDPRDLPNILVERLQHYFLTYRLVPGESPTADIRRIYGCKHASKVVNASIEDYKASFGKYPDATA